MYELLHEHYKLLASQHNKEMNIEGIRIYRGFCVALVILELAVYENIVAANEYR
ncbi:hypothetical protein KSZ_17470 [Dictyobacter formicarum]|uniref:Uncharacterized protein n=1 Tax=Dictyobacter formicarum TaxID=2778368 RepID=A0ABQ3VE17_9CHLR|nr:hypothetical protein KSZ_17470 [Dictyobacter formicarum]